MTKGNAYHVRIPADWLNDARIVDLSVGDRGVFLAMITMSFNQGTKGRLTESQIRNCVPRRTKIKPHLDSLGQAKLIERDESEAGTYLILRPAEWGCGGSPNESSSGSQVVANSTSTGSQRVSNSTSSGSQRGAGSSPTSRQRSADGFKLAAQMIAGSKNAFHNDPDALREEKNKTESIRSPSGSDRMDSAQAAPRDAGGATQPAPAEQKKNLQPLGEFEDDSENDAVLFAGIEHLSPKDKAFAILAKHRKNNKHSTGRDVPLRNREWTPNRMIEPTDTAELFPGREWPEPSE